jgi:hypothetical protein
MAPNPRGAIVFSVQAEAVHANVRPAEGYLDRVVEIAQRAIAAHQRRARLPQYRERIRQIAFGYSGKLLMTKDQEECSAG